MRDKNLAGSVDCVKQGLIELIEFGFIVEARRMGPETNGAKGSGGHPLKVGRLVNPGGELLSQPNMLPQPGR